MKKSNHMDKVIWIFSILCLVLAAGVVIRFNFFDTDANAKTAVNTEDLTAESLEPEILETSVLMAEPETEEPVIYETKTYTEAERIAMGLEQDTKAPVIEGVEDKSFDQGSNISYKRGVTVTDNSGEDIELVIDTGNLNSMELGDYTVTYTATDSAGNVTVETCTFSIVVPEEPTRELVDTLAQEVLDDILTDDMSKYDQAYAIWAYVHWNVTYVSEGVHDDLEKASYIALTDGKADCYGFAALSEVLLDLAGIDNVMVKRDSTTSLHYWNLVDYGEGYYHFDASPRRIGDPYHCFMQTDEQVAYYGTTYEGRSDYYKFDESLYPERATKIVYRSKYLSQVTDTEDEETAEDDTAESTDENADAENTNESVTQ